MKTLLTILFVCAGFMSFGQASEILLGAGTSINGTADGNMFYKGEQSMPNYMATLGYIYNIDGGWQVGIQAIVSGMSSTTTQPYPGITDGINTNSKKFVFADIATSLCAIGNKSFSISSSDFYGGIALGFGIARSFHSSDPGSGVAYKAPDGGRGFVYGAQVGYIYNISRMFGMGVELTAREYDFIYDAHAPYVKPAGYLHYYMSAYTGAITFRFRFASYDDIGYTHENWYRLHKSAREW